MNGGGGGRVWMEEADGEDEDGGDGEDGGGSGRVWMEEVDGEDEDGGDGEDGGGGGRVFSGQLNTQYIRTCLHSK